MARIVYCHPAKTKYGLHLYTDLDFWDARKILRDVALVKRNFGDSPPGDEFPSQVVREDASPRVHALIKRRLLKAIPAPPRHVVVRSLLIDGFYEFEPWRYFPRRWPSSLIEHFLSYRLPVDHGVLNSPYNTYRLEWHGNTVRVVPEKRPQKHDPVIQTRRQARRHLLVPTCF
ncbi:hypothetical protein [Desulfosoma sp.]|uniref:hypothetical protein n=1 Tax=Desulfosoma sp. TaxID=2603217 RepID=UPI00404B55F9